MPSKSAADSVALSHGIPPRFRYSREVSGRYHHFMKSIATCMCAGSLNALMTQGWPPTM
jgi:hypothetical protein